MNRLSSGRKKMVDFSLLQENEGSEQSPLERVYKLLSKLDSIRVSKDRGSMVSKEADELFYKYIEQVESIFKRLPKPLKWRSFRNNDLILLTDIPLNVQTASVKHGLNKAKI